MNDSSLMGDSKRSAESHRISERNIERERNGPSRVEGASAIAPRRHSTRLLLSHGAVTAHRVPSNRKRLAT